MTLNDQRDRNVTAFVNDEFSFSWESDFIINSKFLQIFLPGCLRYNGEMENVVISISSFSRIYKRW